VTECYILLILNSKMTLEIQVLAWDRQTQICGRVKLVNGIPIFTLFVTDFQKQYIYKITIQNLQA